jgi:large subunit ribosomal protein L21
LTAPAKRGNVVCSGQFSEGGRGSVYAIIKTGGKQYRVEAGDTIAVERLETPVGEKVTLGEVLFLGGEGEPRIGAPRLDGVSVLGTVVDHGRDHKIRVFKYKKRKHYRRTRGHRQEYTTLKIEKIQAS